MRWRTWIPLTEELVGDCVIGSGPPAAVELVGGPLDGEFRTQLFARFAVGDVITIPYRNPTIDGHFMMQMLRYRVHLNDDGSRWLATYEGVEDL